MSVFRGNSYDMEVAINTFNAAGDNRIELDPGPFVAYKYFYQSNPSSSHMYIGVDYVSGYSEGDDLTTLGDEILNKHKARYASRIGNYILQDGRIGDLSSTSVSSNNTQNVVYIYYDADYRS